MRPECGRGPPGHVVTDATRALTPFRRWLHPLDAASVDSSCGPALHGADGFMPGSPEVYRPTALRAVAYVFPRRCEFVSFACLCEERRRPARVDEHDRLVRREAPVSDQRHQ